MRKRTYLGCRCTQCRWNHRVTRRWKQKSHQALRRAEKLAMRKGEEPPQFVPQPFWRS